MSTKLRKQDNTYITAEEIIAGLGAGGGLEVADGSGTENYIPYFDADGKLADSEILVDANKILLLYENYVIADTYLQVHKQQNTIDLWVSADEGITVSELYMTTTGIYSYTSEFVMKDVDFITTLLSVTPTKAEFNVPVVIDNLTPTFIPYVNGDGELVDSGVEMGNPLFIKFWDANQYIDININEDGAGSFISSTSNVYIYLQEDTSGNYSEFDQTPNMIKYLAPEHRFRDSIGNITVSLTDTKAKFNVPIEVEKLVSKDFTKTFLLMGG